jgi:hypothetical protein
LVRAIHIVPDILSQVPHILIHLKFGAAPGGEWLANLDIGLPFADPLIEVGPPCSRKIIGYLGFGLDQPTVGIENFVPISRIEQDVV